MPSLDEIYARHADRYQRLVAREDYRGRVPAAIREIRPAAGLDVVDLGTGTGRLACLLVDEARRVTALDTSPNMLEVAKARLGRPGRRNGLVAAADHRRLPLRDAGADLAVSGWSLCYTVVGYPHTWRDELGTALAEIERILRPGGTQIVFETLGTGYETPHPPAELEDYFAYLDRAGFDFRAIRTDYRFESVAEAESLTRFFFGESLAGKLLATDPAVLPECTGVWSRSFEP